MKLITKYNKLIDEIVFEFVKRLYKEEPWEEEPIRSDYDLMDYQWVLCGPIELWDRYMSLDDIIMCEAHQFPANSVIEYTDYDYERHIDWKEKITNYYNFAKFWKK
jgi:hypothetical protein